jgi:hypothetical protein
MPEEFFSGVESDGQHSVQDGVLTWSVPEKGGTLSYSAKLNRLRSKTSYDAYMNPEWALFRGSDIVPPAATRAQAGAKSNTSLRFRLPKGWSSVTEYEGENHVYPVATPGRRFDRPTGWMLLGRLGTRTDDVAGVAIKVAGPVDQGVRRMDILTFLRWTLPDVVRVFPEFPERFTVFSAGKPMWRGGLSAPASIYMHADRPLLSENGTSTLLHELVHVGTSARARRGADWIVEGIAEYYSLEILRRSGSISRDRFNDSIDKLRQWGKEADSLCAVRSNGPVTASAAVLFYQLARELRKATGRSAALDDVVARLAKQESDITVADLSQLVEQALGEESAVLRRARVQDCDSDGQ